ncbi:MAG: dolichol kinase [Bacteriovoracaceae bacterium]|jgi:diacylglycerol kinase (CTP)
MEIINDDTLAKRSDLHIMRRVWHILCGVVCLLTFYLTKTPILYWGYMALVVACLGFFLDFLRLKNQKINEGLTNLFGPIMRKSEKVSFSGLPFYALGVALSIFFYEESIAILAILFLIFGDPVASIVGVYYGRDRLLPNKTLQGTIAAFSTCLSVAMIYLIVLGVHSPNLILFAFFGAIVGALSELLSAFNIDDNLTIPVISGAALSVLNIWLNVL